MSPSFFKSSMRTLLLIQLLMLSTCFVSSLPSKLKIHITHLSEHNFFGKNCKFERRMLILRILIIRVIADE